MNGKKSEKPGGIYIKDKSAFERYILDKILEMGFSFSDYRWVYKDTSVIMGDFSHK